MNLSQQLSSIMDNLGLLIPEYIIVSTLILILLLDLFGLKSEKAIWSITCLGIIAASYASFSLWSLIETANAESTFLGMISLDSQAIFWKVLIGLSALVVMMINFSRNATKRNAEYYIMFLSILLGAYFLVMSSNFLMVFFCIEIISITSYILTTFSFNKISSETSLKYLLFGATASAIMLYGLSLLFAITGTLEFSNQLFTEGLLNASAIPLIVASVLVLVGFLFKLSAVPMHIWAPDVYNAAPTPAAAYFSVVPKLAGLAILMKVILALNLFGQSPINWIILLSVLAMMSMLIGNFSAIWQNEVKRMMAYSSIAQSGFLISGLAAFSESANANVLFYAAIFAISNLGVFYIIHLIEHKYGFTKINEYRGMVKKAPFMTVVLLVLLLSLTGLPPTAGFTSKLLVFTSVWESYAYHGEPWLMYLLIFGLLNTVVALFYYLKIPYFMIFKSHESDHEPGKQFYLIENLFAILLVVAVLLFFFKPDWLMRMINSVSFTF